MYLHHSRGRFYSSAIIARIISDRMPDHPETMRHLCAIENLEARGEQYSNQSFDVLSAAVAHALIACPDYPLDPPGYGLLVAALEAEGMTTSDAQGVADLHYMKVGAP